jgi:hypothetical protein
MQSRALLLRRLKQYRFDEASSFRKITKMTTIESTKTALPESDQRRGSSRFADGL